MRSFAQPFEMWGTQGIQECENVFNGMCIYGCYLLSESMIIDDQANCAVANWIDGSVKRPI